jgi:hypothetical protein
LTPTGVCCIWNTQSPMGLRSSPPTSMWDYTTHSDGHHTLHLIDPLNSPISHSITLLAPPCTHCGRPCPLNAIVVISTSPAAIMQSEQQACCWWTPPGKPLTSAHAARATVSFGALQLQGVLPTCLLRRRLCQPPPAIPSTDASLDPFRLAYVPEGLHCRVSAAQDAVQCWNSHRSCPPEPIGSPPIGLLNSVALCPTMQTCQFHLVRP